MEQPELPLNPDSHSLPGPQDKLTQAINRIPRRWQREILLARARDGEDLPDWLLEPIDYSYRPASYWTTESLNQLVTNIKGAERKKEALRLIKEGRLDEATEFILADSISAEDRDRLGKIHPTLMGGEYLPDYNPGEVEIARVTLDSTTQDVMSIRAYPKKGGIGYRVEDEYQSTFEIEPEFSKRPLTLRQLVRLIDTGKSHQFGPIGLGIIQIHFDCTDEPVEAFADFMDFSSEFYPALSTHYWFATQRWVQENGSRRAGR